MLEIIYLVHFIYSSLALVNEHGTFQMLFYLPETRVEIEPAKSGSARLGEPSQLSRLGSGAERAGKFRLGSARRRAEPAREPVRQFFKLKKNFFSLLTT